MSGNVFLQFDPPSPMAWLFASLAVAVALCYQVSRVLALRHFDLRGPFFFAPGFLLPEAARRNGRNPTAGYVWLLSVAAYWFLRCLLDATAVKKPRIAPNLDRP